MRGVGIDIVEVDRFKEKCKKPEFLNLVFTEAEQSFCAKRANPQEGLAARFAAKEAYMKAVGTGWTSNADFKEIEVQNNELGNPELVLRGATKSYFEKMKFAVAQLSMSHTSSTAVAVVIII